MMDYLAHQYLSAHGGALADVVRGARGEEAVRQYIRHALHDAEVEAPITETPFQVSLAGYGVIGLVGLAILGNLTGKKWAGTAAALLASHSLYQLAAGRRPLFNSVLAGDESANLIVKVPAQHPARHRVVLVAHVDAKKQPRGVSADLLRANTTAGIVLSAVNGLSQLFGWEGLRRLTAWGMTATLPLLIAQENDALTEIADDNAAAIAALIGLAAHLHHQPLAQTDVWVAFVGAHHAGNAGMHRFLDAHRVELADAWFIVCNQLSDGRLVYASEYSGNAHLSAYRPDGESLTLAETTAKQHPDLGVVAAPIEGVDEVGALAARGFRAISLTAVPDASAQASVASDAAQFALLMMRNLDERQ